MKTESGIPCAKFFFHLLYMLLVGTFRVTGAEAGKRVSLCVCICDCFEVLLTVHLSIILVTDQLNAPILVL